MRDLSLTLDIRTEDERLVAQSAADFHAGKGGVRRARGLRGQVPGFCRTTWSEMAALGWTGLCIAERWGGNAAPLGHALALAGEMGRSLAPEPLVAATALAGGVLAASEHLTLSDEWLPRLSDGTWIPALGWQEPGRGQDLLPLCRAETASDGDVVIDGEKCFVPQGAGADAFIVSVLHEGETALFLIDANASGLTLRHRPRIDGGFWTDLSLRGVRVSLARRLATGQPAARALQRCIEQATLLACGELVGLMQEALSMSMEYIRTRHQFDRPVGSFQALQHLAVDLLLAQEIARCVLAQNARLFEASSGDCARRSSLASQAKARCSESALVVTKGCIQLHGGMGYTEEADIGLYLKRAMVLAAWLGGADENRSRYAALQSAGKGAQDDVDAGSMTEVRVWLEANFPQRLRFPDHRLDSSQATDWLDRLHAKGWAAPNWPVEYGGMGLSAYEQVRFQEECDRVGMNIAPNLGATMLGPLLIRYGTEVQRREHLPKILSGEVRWCQGYSEPGAGSDLASLRTSAVLDGDHFVVNGQKIWTSFAFDAQMMFMLVRTDSSGRKQEGISFLLVDMGTPGIKVRRIYNLPGSAEFCEVFFDNVRVPRDNLVGELHQGWKMAKSLLGSERILLGSPRLARFPLRLLADYAHTHGLDQDSVFRHRFTRLQLEVEDSGAAFVTLVDALRRGREPGPELSILKVWITETFQRVTDLLLETLRETATVNEAVETDEGTRLHAANLFLASRAATIYGGSSEIQRNILAKLVLELPDA